MKRVKVIFFDAAGTLLHVPRGVGFHYAAIAARHGWTIEPAAIGRAFREAWLATPAAPASHAPRPDDGRGWWHELAGRVAAQAEAPADLNFEAWFAELYAHFAEPGVWALYQEVGDVLDLLGHDYRLAVLSNFDGRLRTILAQFGLLDRFEHLFISSELGADKPDPWLFDHVLTAVGVAPEEALLIGDDPERDYAAAQRAGWSAFLLDRPTRNLRTFLLALNRARSTTS